MSILGSLNISYEFWTLQTHKQTDNQPSSIQNWKVFSSRKEIDEAYTASTISIRDKIIYIDHKFEKVNISNKRDNFFDTDNVSYGKCLTIHHDKPLNGTNDFLEVSVSIKGLDFSRAIDIWFHQRGSENFLGLSNFVGGVSMFVMQYGNLFHFSLKKKIIKYNNENCKSSETFSGYAKCIEGAVQKKVKETMQNDNLPCYMPYISHFVDEQANVCQRIDDWRQTFGNITQTAESFITNSIAECPRPCLKEEFSVSLRTVPDVSIQDSASRILFHISFEEMNIEHLEEYVLFDFGAIVGAVGGSLGLFLGFSFLDVCLAAADFVKSHFQHFSNAMK
jgi:hypothetical protein